jgi:hypothetical protein
MDDRRGRTERKISTDGLLKGRRKICFRKNCHVDPLEWLVTEIKIYCS